MLCLELPDDGIDNYAFSFHLVAENINQADSMGITIATGSFYYTYIIYIEYTILFR